MIGKDRARLIEELQFPSAYRFALYLPQTAQAQDRLADDAGIRTQKAVVEIIPAAASRELNVSYVIPNDASVGRSIAEVMYNPRSRW